MTENPIVADDYDTRYSEWKSWGDDSFGKLSRWDRRYFDGEMKRAGITLEPGARVLEIGFGNGTFLSYAVSRGWSATGTELNPALVDAARRAGLDVSLAGDLAAFADGGFDAVFAFDVVEHIDGAHLVSFLAEIGRVCKPGAPFVLRVPNGDSPFGLVNQNGDVTHVSAVGRHKINYVAGVCGADVTYYGGEYIPWRVQSPKITILRILGAPVRAAMNFIVQYAVFPEIHIAYSARNVVYALRMASRSKAPTEPA